MPTPRRIETSDIAGTAAVRQLPIIPKFIQRNRQIAHALASGMVDGVGDCGSDPHDADLAEILDAERID